MIINENGNKEWYLERDGTKHLYTDNKLHRKDGPAVEHAKMVIKCCISMENFIEKMNQQ